MSKFGRLRNQLTFGRKVQSGRWGQILDSDELLALRNVYRLPNELIS